MGSINYFYENWNTRWLAIGWMNVVFAFSGILGSLLVYHIFSLFLLWLSFYRLVANFIIESSFVKVVVAGFLVVSFFYSCFSISDVFFWVNTSTMYLYGTIAFLFALGEFMKKGFDLCGFVVLVFSGMYLGGSYEPLVFTAMVASVVLLVYKFRNASVRVIWKPLVLKTIIFLSVLMIAFAISYSGEGHVIRSSFLPQTTISFKILVLLKALIKMIFIFIPSKILASLLFAFPWLLMGMWKPFHQVTTGVLKKATILFVILIIISMVPLAFIMSEMGPERAWTQVSLFLVMYTSLLAAYAGSVLKKKYDTYNVSRLYAVIAFLYVVATGVSEVIQAKRYSFAYDSRMKTLAEIRIADEKSDVVSLKPLPASGWLHSAEISVNKDHFTNQHLKKYLELEFDVVSAEQLK